MLRSLRYNLSFPFLIYNSFFPVHLDENIPNLRFSQHSGNDNSSNMISLKDYLSWLIDRHKWGCKIYYSSKTISIIVLCYHLHIWVQLWKTTIIENCVDLWYHFRYINRTSSNSRLSLVMRYIYMWFTTEIIFYNIVYGILSLWILISGNNILFVLIRC